MAIKEKEEIKIIFQYYLPDDIIQGFKDLELDTKTNIKFQIETEEESEWSNFIGEEVIDIVLHIPQHAWDYLIGGIFWEVIKFLWNKLSILSHEKLEDNGKTEGDPKSICLKLVNKERIAEIEFKGDIKEAEMDKVINKMIGFVNSEKLETAFTTPDFWPNINETPNIRLHYNEEIEIWEPVNYGNYRRQNERLSKLADEYLSN